MEKKYKVFICLLHGDGEKKNSLKQTLCDIFRLRYANFEVILIDNGSCDNSAEQTKLIFPKITLIKNKENIGSSAGYNLGIKYALERGADYVFILKQGVKFKKNLLDILVGSLEKNNEVAMASPLIFENKKNKISFSGGKINYLTMKTKIEKKKLASDNTKTHFLKEGAVLIRKEVFKKINLLDENYFMFWSLIDFSARAKKSGCYLSVCPEASIICQEDFSQEQKYWEKFGRLLFFKKNTPFFLKWWINFIILFLKNKHFLLKEKNQNYSNKLAHKIYSDLNPGLTRLVGSRAHAGQKILKHKTYLTMLDKFFKRQKTLRPESRFESDKRVSSKIF